MLGSLPGAASLNAREYYAHPRNLFWPFAAEMFGFDQALPYRDRLQVLYEAGVGLWDVLASCERAGSSDSAIVPGSECANDIAGWLAGTSCKMIAVNGAKAHALLWRLCGTQLQETGVLPRAQVLRLPSTSPANAALSRAHKLAAWGALADAVRERNAT